ncbi:MAG: hypothetical protein ACK6BC_05495 [Cyanobacteriota bacterium]
MPPPQAMTACPSAFLAFVAQHSASFTPHEQAALLSCAERIDSSGGVEALTSQLSRFLLDQPAIDDHFHAHFNGQGNGQPQRGIGGQPIKLSSEAFKSNLRNVVLHPQQQSRKDEPSTPKG